MRGRLLSYQRLPRLAWTLWCLIMLLFVALHALRLWDGFATMSSAAEIIWAGVLIPAAVPAYATVGAVVASRLPGNRVGWLCLALAAVVAIQLVSLEYVIRAFVVTPGTLPAGVLAAWIGTVSSSVLLLPFMLMLLFFPDGSLPSRRWRFVVWTVVAINGLNMLSAVIGPDLGESVDRKIPNPTAIEGLEGVAGMMADAVFVAGPILILASVASLFVRRRRAGGNQRQQLKWLAYAGAIIVSALLAGVASAYFFGGQSRLLFVALSVGIAGITIGIPIAMGVAMLRHRLYDIDIVINKTLVYGPLSATLALTYLVGVAGSQYVFRVLTGQERLPQLAIVASTLVIAALFNPLRRRIQDLIDRRFYRKKYDAAETLAAFTSRLRDETDMEMLEEDLVSVVRDTLDPARVSLWLPRPGHGEDNSRGEQR